MGSRSAARLTACCWQSIARPNVIRGTNLNCRSKLHVAALEHDDFETSDDHLAAYMDQELIAAQLDLQQFVDLRQNRVDFMKRMAPERAINPAKQERGKPTTRGSGGLMPFAVFRQRLYKTPKGDNKRLRAMLDRQLQHCTTPQDMIKVLVIAMTDSRPQVWWALSRLESTIKQAWYRSRHEASDPQVLRTIMQFIGRFEMAGVPVAASHRIVAVKFAARCRDLNLMRRCLRKYKDNIGYMSNHWFRSVVAKCSIGRRGLGAIRNGNWQPDELRQVLTGFDCEKHLPMPERCHLETFVNRAEWEYLHGFLCALGIVKATDLLQKEWELFKQNPLRTQPRKLHRAPDPYWTSKTRGELLFIECMDLAGDGEKAWQIFRECNIRFDRLKPWVLHDLLRNAHLAGYTARSLRTHLIRYYGHCQLPSGQLLKTSCTLDSVDADGFAVFSKETTAAIHEALHDKLAWYAFYVPGKINNDAMRETQELHAAEIGELVEDDVD